MVINKQSTKSTVFLKTFLLISIIYRGIQKKLTYFSYHNHKIKIFSSTHMVDTVVTVDKLISHLSRSRKNGFILENPLLYFN